MWCVQAKFKNFTIIHKFETLRIVWEYVTTLWDLQIRGKNIMTYWGITIWKEKNNV